MRKPRYVVLSEDEKEQYSIVQMFYDKREAQRWIATGQSDTAAIFQRLPKKEQTERKRRNR